MATKLFIGSLAWATRDEALMSHFATIGEVESARVVMDKMTGRSKGFGFVTFATEEAAAAATQQMHEKEVEGRKIVVNVARPREERRPGGGGFNRGGGGGGFRDDRRSY